MYRKTITNWIGAVCLILATLAMQGCVGDAGGPSADGGKGGGKGGGKRGKFNDSGAGPVPVVVASVGRKDVPIEVAVVGNVEAYATISVISQVSGQLTEVFFNEGDFVKKGQKLFQIDPRPLQAQLQQAQATLARDQAQVTQLEANLARDTASEQNARADATRYAQLFKEGIVSKQQGDQYNTSAETLSHSVQADKAAIQSSRAQIEADQASIENVKIQLGFTTIYSPLEGRTGNLTIKQGSIVSGNQTSLIAITQVEPIYVTFSVPEVHLADIKRYMAVSKLPVTARTQDGTGVETGELTFVDNNVDVTTGTIKLKGTFRNMDHQLWPGQFVNVILRLTTKPNAIVVPNQAVQSGQDGTFVYVVKEDRSVEARPVVTAQRVDQLLVIDKGLADGETVVTEGQLRLAPGTKVQYRGAGGPDGREKDGREKGDAKGDDNSGKPGRGRVKGSS
jgi:multidrug efflux system membrane fusion protein